ncbi:MAG TPA: nuclear transport factor 2 family protein [Blastocatellia bacterium]|nr:nuclear transport factor 2 family protein [Blastocatellia bacterium]
MRLRVVLAFSLIALLAVAVCGAQKASRRKAAGDGAATKAILAVLDKQVAAWNRHDLEGFMAGYRNSEKLSFYSGGIKTSGWTTTLERYRNRYQGEGHEMGRLEFTDLEVETLGPDSAFVRGHWNLKMSGGDQGGLFTLIFRKFGDGWKIIHDHTSAAS